MQVDYCNTYETPEEVQETLKKVNFHTIVVSDTTNAMHRLLKIQSSTMLIIPRPVLIDDDNKVIWYGHPSNLTSALVWKFIRKQKIKTCMHAKNAEYNNRKAAYR